MRGLSGRDRRWIQIIASKISGGSRNATLPPLFISALAVCQSLLPLFDQAGARSQPFLGQCPSHKASHKRGERSEEHTSELQSLMRISYAVFCLKKKTNTKQYKNDTK